MGKAGDFKVFVNFKTYPQGTGARAVELAEVCRRVSEETGVVVIPIVQVVDLARVKEKVGDFPVWVQHIDWQPQGKFTGFVNLEAVVEAGAGGSLINHSEHPLPFGTIKQILARVKKSGFDFKTMVCGKTLGQLERIARLKPAMIGYEIAQLIGGEVSIVDFNPKAVVHAKRICGEIPLIAGAGIHKKEDLKRAFDLGCEGVLVSSAVVLAENPFEKLKELLELVLPAQGGY